MPDILVSVVITVYPTYRFLRRAVQSIKDQLYKNIEIIIVNDGINEHLDIDGCTIINNKEREGTFHSRCTGIKASNGDYIQFLDADDIITVETIKYSLQRSKDFDADILSYKIKGNHIGFINNKEIYGQDNILKEYEFRCLSNLQNIHNALYKRHVVINAISKLNVKEKLYWGEDILLNYAIMKQSKRWIHDNSSGKYIILDNPFRLSKNITKKEKEEQLCLIRKYMKSFD